MGRVLLSRGAEWRVEIMVIDGRSSVDWDQKKKAVVNVQEVHFDGQHIYAGVVHIGEGNQAHTWACDAFINWEHRDEKTKFAVFDFACFTPLNEAARVQHQEIRQQIQAEGAARMIKAILWTE